MTWLQLLYLTSGATAVALGAALAGAAAGFRRGAERAWNRQDWHDAEHLLAFVERQVEAALWSPADQPRPEWLPAPVFTAAAPSALVRAGTWARDALEHVAAAPQRSREARADGWDGASPLQVMALADAQASLDAEPEPDMTAIVSIPDVTPPGVRRLPRPVPSRDTWPLQRRRAARHADDTGACATLTSGHHPVHYRSDNGIPLPTQVARRLGADWRNARGRYVYWATGRMA